MHIHSMNLNQYHALVRFYFFRGSIQYFSSKFYLEYGQLSI